MQAKMLLFTSPTCPHCPAAKQAAAEVAKSRNDVVFEELSTALPKTQKKAQKYEIRSVPTFIINGPAFSENIGLAGVQSKEVLHKYLDISLGKRELEQKKSFTDKLKEGFRIGKLRIRF